MGSNFLTVRRRVLTYKATASLSLFVYQGKYKHEAEKIEDKRQSAVDEMHCKHLIKVKRRKDKDLAGRNFPASNFSSSCARGDRLWSDLVNCEATKACVSGALSPSEEKESKRKKRKRKKTVDFLFPLLSCSSEVLRPVRHTASVSQFSRLNARVNLPSLPS